MTLTEFVAVLVVAARALQALVPPHVLAKKVIDITLDAALPVQEDGTPYTRPELYALLVYPGGPVDVAVAAPVDTEIVEQAPPPAEAPDAPAEPDPLERVEPTQETEQS